MGKEVTCNSLIHGLILAEVRRLV